jgi:methylenetetrahydrofolate dehydrogenase (NADP+)/methenyltetrahydrofolate cyclohydrolase
MVHLPVVCPGDVSQEDLEARIFVLCGSYNVHGLLMFSPLPAHLDEAWARACIHPDKDVDCLTLANAAKVFMGDRSGFAPCTAEAVIEILRHYGVPLRGATVCVVGAGAVVGKPLAMLLMGKNATVTVCHTRTPDLGRFTRQADILVVATGHPGTVNGDMVREGAVVVDVGVNRVPDATKQRGYRLCGDVDFDSAREVAGWITPVPGGVGPLTIAMLLKNTVAAARRRRAARP